MENAFSINTPEEMGYQRLLGISTFPTEQYREAIGAIISELQNNKENPKEFYTKLEPSQTDSNITLELIHENSFEAENINKVGNPSGKDRKAIYDFASNKVDFLLWK